MNHITAADETGAPMIVISRDACGLRPAKHELEHVRPHPGIIIHCTGGQRPASLEHAMKRWRIVQLSHQRERGWADIGYHFGVTPDGQVLEGRGFGVLGAHAKGHNRLLGVVVLGKGTEITPAEERAIEAIHAALLAGGGGAVVMPHNAVSRKSCPGPAVTAWMRQRWPEDPIGR